MAFPTDQDNISRPSQMDGEPDGAAAIRNPPKCLTLLCATCLRTAGHFFEDPHMDPMIDSVQTYVRRRLTENTR